MAKVELNTLVNAIRGTVDKAVLRKYKGQTILSRKPVYEHVPSPAQVAQQERFRSAADFGNYVMADNAVRPLYEQAAAEREIPIFAICIADFFNAPQVTSIDPIDYNGQVGNLVKIVASDDFGVARVHVVLSDDDEGTLIESGEAVETPASSGHWTYTATQAVTPGITVQFQATAFDRPGGAAVLRGTKRI